MNKRSSRTFVSNIASSLHPSQKRSDCDVAPLPLSSPSLAIGLCSVGQKLLKLLLAQIKKVSGTTRNCLGDLGALMRAQRQCCAGTWGSARAGTARRDCLISSARSVSSGKMLMSGWEEDGEGGVSGGGGRGWGGRGEWWRRRNRKGTQNGTKLEADSVSTAAALTLSRTDRAPTLKSKGLR